MIFKSDVLPGRLMVGQWPLKPLIGVRVPARQLEQLQLRCGALEFSWSLTGRDSNRAPASWPEATVRVGVDGVRFL